MLLSFKKRDGTSITVGPLKALRFDGAEMRETPGGPLIARHEGHHWDVRGEAYLRLDYEGPLTNTFENAAVPRVSRTFGPYEHLSSVDGMTYVNHELFCQFSPQTNLWYFRQEGTEWPTFVVRKT